jgi:ectoine hydroxylase-related dioxygenase (phytanoyl-CoA dioxygenase family)
MMLETETLKSEIESSGFVIIENVFSAKEIEEILAVINETDLNKPTFRKTTDLFAIRQFFKEIPGAIPLVFIQSLKNIIEQLFGKDFFVVKSIYFDKPEDSNWFVSYHQDLTISVDKKSETEDFGLWTKKQNQYAVQPPLEILQNNFTIRIHLDDTDENNGALNVIQGSHLNGIYRPEPLQQNKGKEVICRVTKGSVMIMRPLLLHSSNRTINHKRRRVIHIEFSNSTLPKPLKWSEKVVFYDK